MEMARWDSIQNNLKWRRRRLCLLEEQSGEQRRLCRLEERTVQPERVNEPQTLQGNMTSKEFLLEKKKGSQSPSLCVWACMQHHKFLWVAFFIHAGDKRYFTQDIKLQKLTRVEKNKSK
ncbi:hypothetical protein E2320_014625 [Naja naja]|nr:hypothetical protein E2320_014625 [Naja naja]